MEPSSPDPGAATPPGTSARDEPPSTQGPAERLQEARVRRRSALRQALVVGLSIIALVCLGGGAAAFLFYDKATRPDLRTPVLATEQYLTAYLGDRDDSRASQFRCGDPAGLSDVRALRADIDSKQKEFGIPFVVSVDSVRELNRAGNTATVAADLAITTTVQGQSRRELEHWEFITRNDNGWRVCSGHEVT